MSNKFEIDFFEFSFLVEACIPDRPIARAMFWESVSEKYYHQMTKDQRAKLFEWIQLNHQFQLSNPDCLHFYDRFNPDNQYVATVLYDGKESKIECYLYGGQYHTSKSRSILEQYILKIEKHGVGN